MSRTIFATCSPPDRTCKSTREKTVREKRFEMTTNSSDDRPFDLDECARAAAEAYVDSLDWGSDPNRYSLTRYAIEIGFIRGYKMEYYKTKLHNIAALMETLSLTMEEACRVLKVPEDKWDELRTGLPAE